MVKSVNGSQAKALVAKGARIIDVRTPEEFAGGAIPGAVNISVQTLPNRIGEVGDDKDTPVILYCRSGVRSATAGGILAKAGYTDIYDLGGIGNW